MTNNEPGGAWDQQREIERLSPKPVTEPRTKAGKALLNRLHTRGSGDNAPFEVAIARIETEAAHPDGYSEPPEPSSVTWGFISPETGDFIGVTEDGMRRRWGAPVSGYSEPPEPREAAEIVEAIALLVEGGDDSRPLLDSLPVELTDRIEAFLNRAPVSGYSEPGMERPNRIAAVRAMHVLIDEFENQQAIDPDGDIEGWLLDRLIGPLNLHAAALAAYLGGASPQPQQPVLREALQAVWDIGDELDSNHARYAAKRVAEQHGIELRWHNDLSGPPRNRNEEQIAALQGEVDRLTALLATHPTSTPEAE